MTRAALTVAGLLIAWPAAAWPIGLGSRHCVCTLVAIAQAPEPDPDPAWTLAQIAELQRLDDLHEPPAGTVGSLKHVVTCFEDQPTDSPDEPHLPHGGGGQPGDGGHSGGIPEPSLGLLLAVAGAGVVRRWRRR